MISFNSGGFRVIQHEFMMKISKFKCELQCGSLNFELSVFLLTTIYIHRPEVPLCM